MMAIDIQETENFNLALQGVHASPLKVSGKDHLLECRGGAGEAGWPCAFPGCSQGCSSSGLVWWVLQVLQCQPCLGKKAVALRHLAEAAGMSDAGWFAYSLPETGRDCSFASAYSS